MRTREVGRRVLKVILGSMGDRTRSKVKVTGADPFLKTEDFEVSLMTWFRGSEPDPGLD